MSRAISPSILLNVYISISASLFASFALHEQYEMPELPLGNFSQDWDGIVKKTNTEQHADNLERHFGNSAKLLVIALVSSAG